MAEKMANKRYGSVQFGHVHVHLPLHLVWASETMVPAPPPPRYDREFPGVPRMGTNGSTMLQPLRQGLPPLNLAAASDAASCALHARYEAVRDPSDEGPVTREAEDLSDDCSAESGRGLFLVDSFSDSWGWHPLAGALGGKVVWALFRLPQP